MSLPAWMSLMTAVLSGSVITQGFYGDELAHGVGIVFGGILLVLSSMSLHHEFKEAKHERSESEDVHAAP